MPKFQFQFESLLRLAERQRDATQGKINSLRAEQRSLTGKQEHCIAKRDDPNLYTKLLHKPSRGASQVLDARKLAEIDIFRQQLQSEIDAIDEQFEFLEQQLSPLLATLTKQESRVRMLLELEAQERIMWKRQAEKLAQTQLDEIAALRAAVAK